MKRELVVEGECSGGGKLETAKICAAIGNTLEKLREEFELDYLSATMLGNNVTIAYSNDGGGFSHFHGAVFSED